MKGQFEPHGAAFVRPMRAHYTERVRIHWTLADGSTFTEDHTAPGAEVVEAVRRKRAQTNEQD